MNPGMRSLADRTLNSVHITEVFYTILFREGLTKLSGFIIAENHYLCLIIV